MREAVLSHPNVKGVVDPLRCTWRQKQILVNAHVKLDDKRTAAKIEEKIMRAEPKVDMIFLVAASVTDMAAKEPRLRAYRIGYYSRFQIPYSKSGISNQGSSIWNLKFEIWNLKFEI